MSETPYSAGGSDPTQRYEPAPPTSGPPSADPNAPAYSTPQWTIPPTDSPAYPPQEPPQPAPPAAPAPPPPATYPSSGPPAATYPQSGPPAAYIESHDRGTGTFGGARQQALTPEDRRRVFVQILPWLRGRLVAGGAGNWARQIATVQDDEPVLRFVNSRDAARLAELGTSCPDHFLRTKIKPLFVDWTPGAAEV